MQMLRTIAIVLALLGISGLLGYQLELTLPTRPPRLEATETPITKAPPSGIGSYDVLGHVVTQAEADHLLETDAG